jgi:hypothetical protein
MTLPSKGLVHLYVGLPFLLSIAWDIIHPTHPSSLQLKFSFRLHRILKSQYTANNFPEKRRLDPSDSIRACPSHSNHSTPEHSPLHRRPLRWPPHNPLHHSPLPFPSSQLDSSGNPLILLIHRLGHLLSPKGRCRDL